VPPAPGNPFLAFCHGEDDLAVKQRARSLFDQWSKELGGMDHEIIDGHAGTASEAFKSINRLREALMTLPFFGGGKAIWWQGCSFLGDDRTASAESVVQACAELGGELSKFPWGNVRLVISAGKADKRRSFFKALTKAGVVEEFTAWADDPRWADRAGHAAEVGLKARGKEIAHDALSALTASIGPNPRQLESEVEKLSLFVGDRTRIQIDDVEAIVTRNKQARAFALGEAFGERNLPKLLRRLDEEMWEMQFDKAKTEFGLLALLIMKVRGMLIISELLRLKYLRPDTTPQNCSAQVQRIPPEKLPEDKRYNPIGFHPYVVAKTVEHCRNYTQPELVRAMEVLLRCNRKLVGSQLETKLVLQQALVEIAGGVKLKGSSRASSARG